MYGKITMAAAMMFASCDFVNGHFFMIGHSAEHDRLAADLHHRDRERDRNRGIRHVGCLQCSLCLVDRGVLDEARIVRLLPGAVVEHRHFGVADLELGIAALEKVDWRGRSLPGWRLLLRGGRWVLRGMPSSRR